MVMKETKHDIWIIDKSTNQSHLARKIIFGENQIDVWSNTWYGRHVIGLDCEFDSSKNHELHEANKEVARLQVENERLREVLTAASIPQWLIDQVISRK